MSNHKSEFAVGRAGNFAPLRHAADDGNDLRSLISGRPVWWAAMEGLVLSRQATRAAITNLCIAELVAGPFNCRLAALLSIST
jgi:hypothetical protein